MSDDIRRGADEANLSEKEAVELLPIYLGGGLDAARTAALEAKLASSPRLREELATWRRAFDLHVAAREAPLDDVVAYVDGSLEPEMRREIEAWADGSESARTEIDLLRRSLAGLEQSVVEAGDGSDLEPSAETGATLLPFRGHRRPGWAGALLAAGLASVVTSLLWWSSAPPGAGGPAPTWQANVPIVEVLPDSAARRGPGDDGVQEPTVRRVQVPAGANTVVLILVAERDPGPGVLRLEAVDPGGDLIWFTENLERDPRGEYTVALPATVARGQIELKVRRGDDLIESYRLDFSPEQP